MMLKMEASKEGYCNLNSDGSKSNDLRGGSSMALQWEHSSCTSEVIPRFSLWADALTKVSSKKG